MVHEVSSRASVLVVNALSFLGVRYRYGGDHAAKGFDCSGLVQRVYQETLGLVLPHNAAQQSREGEKIAENELRPGDLVFFNTLRRAFSHVGIYIGNGQFVHAPRPGQRVQIANLDSPYWARRFDGARRLITHATEPLLPSAQAASTEPRVPGTSEADAGARNATRPAAALPLSNAIPAGASPETTALMAGALLPRPTSEPDAH
ncbi:MAG: C40 family peptidase [Betaproteobacteria bacterium]|nr:C40 family peptidase [Betaproteobacteria bacterium]